MVLLPKEPGPIPTTRVMWGPSPTRRRKAAPHQKGPSQETAEVQLVFFLASAGHLVHVQVATILDPPSAQAVVSLNSISSKLRSTSPNSKVKYLRVPRLRHSTLTITSITLRPRSTSHPLPNSIHTGVDSTSKPRLRSQTFLPPHTPTNLLLNMVWNGGRTPTVDLRGMLHGTVMASNRGICQLLPSVRIVSPISVLA
jgi:hypothetical protein